MIADPMRMFVLPLTKNVINEAIKDRWGYVIFMASKWINWCEVWKLQIKRN